MRAFFDTEFSGYINPELISVGVVGWDGLEFYAERPDVVSERCSDFVQAHVLPHLGQHPLCRCDLAEMSRRLVVWLGACGIEVLVCDSEYDRMMLAALLPQEFAIRYEVLAPALVNSRQFRRNLWSAFSNLPDGGRTRHHALTDARALAGAVLAMEADGQGVGLEVDCSAGAHVLETVDVGVMPHFVKRATSR